MTSLLELENALQQAETQYYRLVLLVGPRRSRESPILRELGDRLDRPIVKLNLPIAEQLLDCAPKKRPLKAQEVVRATVAAAGVGPVILDNIEILFDPDLKLDPLAVLHALSRNRTLLVAWPGRMEDGKLCYAKRDHPEFRQYADPNAILLEMTAH